MKDYSKSEFNGCRFVREMPSVMSPAGNKRRVAIWQCSCGKEFQAAINNVASGQVKSCGCKKRIAVIERCTKHGQSPMAGGSRAYRFWQSMKERCLNPNNDNYQYYGGRGIKMHAAWVNSFTAFYGWFKETFGVDDVPGGLTMDRKENDGPYAPGNIRMVTMKVQNNNKRSNRVLEYQGERMTLTQLAERFGIKPGTLWARISIQGKTVEEAIV
jgi:hypothetical protein